MRSAFESAHEIKTNAGGLRSVSAGAGALALLVGLVVGVPLVLVALVGNPLPTSAPSWGALSEIIDSGALPSVVLVKVVACFVWFWWSQLAISAVSEVTACLRDRTARRLPFGGFGTQRLVVRLLAAVMATLAGLGVVAGPAAASPSFDGVTVDARSPASSSTLEMPAGTASEESDVFLVPISDDVGSDAFSEAKLREQILERLRSALPESAGEFDAPSGGESDALSGGSKNVLSAGESDAPSGVSTEVRNPSVWVIVQPGDTLWSLADTHLGDPNRWREIFDLNAGSLSSGGVLSQPNVIHPGWRLKLPSPRAIEETASLQGSQAAPVSEAVAPILRDATLAETEEATLDGEGAAENLPLLYPPGHSSFEIGSSDSQRSADSAPRLFPSVRSRLQAEVENGGNSEA